ncbi:MAG: hypothetical protein LBT52_03235, partial [Clostridiales Family XIII bacterium]|nr:hypothetical protein [Clostridiales Family XIII bacterium]
WDRGDGTGNDGIGGGPDEIEDIRITKHYRLTNASTIPGSTKVVNVGTSFTDGPVSIEGYDYYGYKAGAAPLIFTPLAPSIAISAGDADFTVTYAYQPAAHDLTLQYVDNYGAQVPGKTDVLLDDAFVTDEDYELDSSYYSLEDYDLIGWKIFGAADWETTPPPAFTGPNDNVTIVLRYIQDKNHNDIEDFTITEEHRSNNASSDLLKNPAALIYVDKDDSYNGTPDSDLLLPETGNEYAGYRIDGLPAAPDLSTGNPGLTNLNGPHTVVYYYNVKENDIKRYKVTVTYEMRDGTALSPPINQVEMIEENSAFNTTTTPKLKIPSFSGKIFVDWSVDGGALQGNTLPGIASVTGDAFVVLVYQLTKPLDTEIPPGKMDPTDNETDQSGKDVVPTGQDVVPTGQIANILSVGTGVGENSPKSARKQASVQGAAPFEKPGAADEDSDTMAPETPDAQKNADGYWALLDLILTILSMLAVIVAIVIRRSRRKADEAYREDDLQQTTHGNREAFVFLTVIIAAINLALLFITQNFSKGMIWIDRWTIIFLILCALNVVMSIESCRRTPASPRT